MTDPEKVPRSAHGVSIERRTGYEAPGVMVNWRSNTVLPVDGHPSGTFDHTLGGALLSCWSHHERGIRANGTAFMAAPGIALTAAHVLRDWADQSEKPTVELVSADGRHLRSWAVDGGVTINGGDIAILTLSPTFKYDMELEIPTFPLSARVPQVNEKVMTLGLRPAKDNFEAQGEPVELIPIYSTGRVREFHVRRPPFSEKPIIETDVLTIGAMSGGPIFDMEGYVIGLNSGSIDLGDGNFVSYGSLFFEALFAEVSPTWPKGLLPSPMSLANLPVRYLDFLTLEGGQLRYSPTV